MINYKKEQLIKKHLGKNTPDWIIKNCISLINEFEEIELLKLPQEQANGVEQSESTCNLQNVIGRLFDKLENRFPCKGNEYLYLTRDETNKEIVVIRENDIKGTVENLGDINAL